MRYRIRGRLDLSSAGGALVDFTLSLEATSPAAARAGARPLLGGWPHVIDGIDPQTGPVGIRALYRDLLGRARAQGADG